MNGDTYPVLETRTGVQSEIVIAPSYKDSATGALYVHRDLIGQSRPYDDEAHVRPMSVTEKFGDIESFVAYLIRYGGSGHSTLVRWCSGGNSGGMWAVLDYANALEEIPGRCQWRAAYPFEFTAQMRDWAAFASGNALSQRIVIEKLEDLAEDIVSPSATDLIGLLRTLRASANAKADTELRADGTTAVIFTRDTAVKTGSFGDLMLPPSLKVAIPILKGHTTEDGKPALFAFNVRIRATVDDGARLAFKLTIPNLNRVLETVFADRVATATKLLEGTPFELLRAADGQGF